nr:hypothetical protein [Mannheimia haemolytica]
MTDEVLTLDRNTLTAQTAKTGIIAVTRVKDGANVLNADRYSVESANRRGDLCLCTVCPEN